MKILKNIEDKSKEQLLGIKKGIRSINYILDKDLSLEVKNVLVKLSNQEKYLQQKA